MQHIDLTEIETILQAHRKEFEQQYGVSAMGVFGSHARGEAGPDSDIDILVEFHSPVGFFKFLELEEQLGKYLGKKVDLVTRGALKPHIGRQILSEVAML
ncbi:MAG: nucleotidyltransferase family protein [Desulfobacterales bacterium]|nr:nucleotidyltransferase family protein [Desulfobacterales bacterium]